MAKKTAHHKMKEEAHEKAHHKDKEHYHEHSKKAPHKKMMKKK